MVRSAGRVLSVAKLRVGQEAYQLSGVAQSLDDYYTGAGEAAGRWIGAGAERLGLAGEVAPDDLRAVLAGMAPGSGGLTPNGETIRPHPRRVPGFDLTFKTPKSVSVLYAVSDDPRVQGAIIEAGETAVREALGWLEREAVHVRRGTGNEAFLTDLAARDPDAAAAARIRTLPGQGVVAATFRHRTSRAGDPLLHWHTLVANLVEGPDGRWSAFVHPDLYRAYGPRARCSRPSCGPSSPSGWGSSGGPAATSPRSPVSPKRCATCSPSDPARSRTGWKQPAPPTTRPAASRRYSPHGATSPKWNTNASTPRGRPRPSTPAGDPTPPKPSSPAQVTAGYRMSRRCGGSPNTSRPRPERSWSTGWWTPRNGLRICAGS